VAGSETASYHVHVGKHALPAVQVIARIQRYLHVRPFEYHEAAERVGVEHPPVRRNVSYEDRARRGDSRSAAED